MKLGVEQVNILLKQMDLQKKYMHVPDDVEEVVAPNVKTTQHFNDVELDVQKGDIFAEYDAQEVVALSQVATYVKCPHQIFSTTDRLLLHRHMNT
jgi:hypothetical protein